MTLCSLQGSYHHFRGTCNLKHEGSNPSALKQQAAGCTEMLVIIYQTTTHKTTIWVSTPQKPQPQLKPSISRYSFQSSKVAPLYCSLLYMLTHWHWWAATDWVKQDVSLNTATSTVILSHGTLASAGIFMTATVLRETVNEALCIIQLYYYVQWQQNF